MSRHHVLTALTKTIVSPSTYLYERARNGSQSSSNKFILIANIANKSDLVEISSALTDIDTVALDEVEATNSAGVAGWLSFVKGLSKPLAAENLLVMFAEHAGTIRDFLDNLRASSVKVSFHCENLDQEKLDPENLKPLERPLKACRF